MTHPVNNISTLLLNSLECEKKTHTALLSLEERCNQIYQIMERFFALDPQVQKNLLSNPKFQKAYDELREPNSCCLTTIQKLTKTSMLMLDLQREVLNIDNGGRIGKRFHGLSKI